MSSPSSQLSPTAYLAAAERMLREVVPGARGMWPRACAWLSRLALETAMDEFWAAMNPSVATCQSRRAQLLLLRGYLAPQIARRTHHAWTALSRAGHHHSYELALTAQELHALAAEVAFIVGALRR